MTSSKQHILDSPIVDHHTSNSDTPESSSNVQVDTPTDSIPSHSPIEFASIDTTIVSPPRNTVPDTLPHEPRRSQRQRNAPNHFVYYGSQGYGYSAEFLQLQHNKKSMLGDHSTSILRDNTKSNYNAAHFVSCNAHFEDGFIEHQDPSAYLQIYNKKLTADTYKYHAVILQPNWELFQESATKDIRTLESMGIWEEIMRSKVKSDKHVLGGTWVFKRKRAPDGKVIKHFEVISK
jgi:hypothetical protein